jgi:hypothetical protein
MSFTATYDLNHTVKTTKIHYLKGTLIFPLIPTVERLHFPALNEISTLAPLVGRLGKRDCMIIESEVLGKALNKWEESKSRMKNKTNKSQAK